MGERFDICVVGAGIAGLTAAFLLVKNGFKVAVFERGEYPGSKNVSGGILQTLDFSKIFDNFYNEAPLERYVSRRGIFLMSDQSAVNTNFISAANDMPPHNHSFSVNRSNFDQWLAQKVEKAGGVIITRTLVDEIIRENGKFSGISTTRIDGQVSCDAVLLAEGANSRLAIKSGMQKAHKPENFVNVSKLVLSLSRDIIEERFALEGNQGASLTFLGYPNSLTSSAFIHTNKESLSIGIGAFLDDLVKKKIRISTLMDGFLKHPIIRPLISGGEPIEYSAHMIPEGGVSPNLVANGLLILGDAAGLINPNPVFFEGMNLAATSSILAAQVLVEAREKGDYSIHSLKKYSTLLEESYVMADVRRYSELPRLIRNNPRLISVYPQLFNTVMQNLFEVDGKSKKEKRKQIMEIIRRKRSLLGLLRDAYTIYRRIL